MGIDATVETAPGEPMTETIGHNITPVISVGATEQMEWGPGEPATF